MALAALAFLYFALHWLLLARSAADGADRPFPEQEEWLNGTAVLGVGVLILVLLRGSMSAAVELLPLHPLISPYIPLHPLITGAA